MIVQRSILMLIAGMGALALLTGGLDLLTTKRALAESLLSEESLQALAAVHKQNIGQLHSLHHEMRATLKWLARDSKDAEAIQQFAAQLRAVSQALDTVASTEKDHPQWAASWSQRHARLLVLTRETETLVLTGQGSPDGNRTLAQIGQRLQEMKELLDIW